MSARSQAVRAPVTSETHQWHLLVAGLVALVLLLGTLVGIATIFGGSSGTSKVGGGSDTSGRAAPSTVRVGGNGPLQYKALP
jgi:hypothetical protein